MPAEARQRLQRRPPQQAAPARGAPQRQPQAPPAAIPAPTGPGRAPGPQEDERAAKEAIMAKISEGKNIPLEALEDFSIQELQLLPKVLEKILEFGLGNQAKDKAMGMSDGGKILSEGLGPQTPNAGARSAQQSKDDLGKEIRLRSPKGRR